MPLPAGTRLGSFEVLAPIGAGGMGEVYRARDARLGRQVAIKVLPDHLADDPAALARFEREARAVASLSHPNILAIFDFGSDGARPYVVLELLAGETLRARLQAGSLPLEEALRLGAQMCAGVAAAHDRGVLHRDLKPENLFLTKDGVLKILDFGLAKMPSSDAAGSQLSTVSPETEAGTVLGTAGYMSPEQVRGLLVDRRSDVFSLGAVLYEMVSGRRAFGGETAADAMSAILTSEPPPLAESDGDLPRGVDLVIRRCLAKTPESRFESARDVAFALDAAMAAAPASTAPRSASRGRLLAVAAAAALLAAGGWALGRLRGAGAPALTGGALSRLTSDAGYEGEATWAPDGNTLAYVSNRTGDFEIFLKQASGGTDVNLTNDPADDVQPAFSPDGKQIAFVSTRGGAGVLVYETFDVMPTGGDVWVMPALGGAPRRIASSGNMPCWSPDGETVFFTKGTAFARRIYRVPASGGEAREIPISFPAARMPSALLRPSVSPDGEWLLFEGERSVWVAPVSGGAATALGEGRLPAWDPSGKSIVYTRTGGDGNGALARLAFSRGRARGEPLPLTFGTGFDTQAAVSRTGGAIAFTALDRSFNLEALPLDAEAGRVLGEPEPLTAGANNIQWKSSSPDGRSVAYGQGNRIWRLDAGGAPVQLTSDPAARDSIPAWSPDGKTIAFQRSAKDGTGIWRMAADGAGPERLVADGGLFTWMPDSSGIVYASLSQRKLSLFEIASKRERRLVDEPLSAPVSAVSPDGKWLVYHTTENGTIDISARPMAGGPARLLVTGPRQDAHPSFSPSGRWLYYQVDHQNEFRVPFPPGDAPAAPEQVTRFATSGLFVEDPKVTPDGRRLLYSRGRIVGDVWVWRSSP